MAANQARSALSLAHFEAQTLVLREVPRGPSVPASVLRRVPRLATQFAASQTLCRGQRSLSIERLQMLPLSLSRL